jgi:hypothetical protein
MALRMQCYCMYLMVAVLGPLDQLFVLVTAYGCPVT